MSNSGPDRGTPPPQDDSTLSLSERERQELRMRYLGFEPRPRSTILAALIGAAAGVLLTGAIWFLIETTRSDDTETAGDAVAATASASPAPSGDSSASESPTSDPDQLAGEVLGTQASRPQPTAVDACRQVVATQRLPLEAAADALGQWEVHVGAMNKLVTGAITLDQATAFWNQTRVGAARRVHTFLDAAAAYREGTQGSCPSPEGVPASASALHACADTVVARNKAISAAETAATTWNGHVRDMEMLRMGHLSPAKATQMWLASWRAGVRQLDAYAVATHKAHAHHC